MEQFVNDESPLVRLGLAKQGYALNVLINDEDPHVRKIAKHMEGSAIHRIERRSGYYENVLFNICKKTEINSLNQMKEIMEKILGV